MILQTVLKAQIFSNQLLKLRKIKETH